MSGYIPTPAEAALVDDLLSSGLFVPAAPLGGGLAEPFAYEDECAAVQQALLDGAR